MNKKIDFDVLTDSHYNFVYTASLGGEYFIDGGLFTLTEVLRHCVDVSLEADKGSVKLFVILDGKLKEVELDYATYE